jgi:ribose transport system ATP-binding protein
MSDDALAFRNLRKSFAGALALDGVSLTVRRQEVHGLLGQNGSGKSTLIKILSGFHAPDPGGELEVFGRPVKLPIPPGQSKRLGIAFVHQHLGMLPSLSVLENLRIGDFATQTRLRIDWRAERARARALFARFGLDLDPMARVESLPPVERALLAIVRAFEDLRAAEHGHDGAGILVLDEPTPFLPKRDVDRLFGLVASIVAAGASVILVSHDIDEVLAITDRATVLSDGRVAGTVVTPTTSREALVELIVGRKLDAYRMHRPPLPATAESIRVEGLTGADITGLSLAARAGEIVGLTGLIGSGYASVPYLLFGEPRARSGTLHLGGEAIAIARLHPAAAQLHRIALLPGDRLGMGGVGGLSIIDNITLPVLRGFEQALGLDRRGMARVAGELSARHDVRPNQPALALESLSGGNQQKVLLAKWLHTGPRLLLLDEPTQGVDFGARQQIFAALDAAAQDGTAILVASTDYEQLAQICDRVLVFSRGRVIAELSGEALTKHRIARECYESSEREAELEMG